MAFEVRNNGEVLDFIIIPHTADIKIRVFGKTKDELFANALHGMFQVVHPQGPHLIEQADRIVCKKFTTERKVVVSAPDCDALLVDFLSEALCLSDIYKEAYFDVRIDTLSNTHITTMILGTEITGFDVVELKAVTYHDLSIKKIDGLWQTDIVFDI